jgi:hypothetical protein
MDDDARQQSDARRPQNLRRGLQEVAVPIDRFWTQEDLQVPQQVADDEDKERGARDCHEEFLPQRRRDQPPYNTHGATWLLPEEATEYQIFF